MQLIQFNTCFTISAVIRDTSNNKLYQEITYKSLQLKRLFENFDRNLCLFYKILKNQNRLYLPVKFSILHITKNVSNLPFFN